VVSIIMAAALEGFALNEEQNSVLRTAARLYRYSICEEDAENDKDWGDVLADANLETLNLLRLALELTHELIVTNSCGLRYLWNDARS